MVQQRTIWQNLLCCHTVAGGSFATTVRILNNLNLTCTSERTFYNNQASFEKSWKHHQQALIQQLIDAYKPLTLGEMIRQIAPVILLSSALILSWS